MGKIKVPVDPTRTEEIRHGRNFIRKGDRVRIAPPEGSPEGTHGQRARFQYAFVDKGGLTYALIEQHRGDKPGTFVNGGWRFVLPERIERKATTQDPRRHDGERKAAKKAARAGKAQHAEA